MSQPLAHPPDSLPKPILPAWVFDRAQPESLEEAVFSSGATLALLHTVLCNPTTQFPADLLRNRLALRAAANCCKIEGRGVTEAKLRDAFLLTLPGDAMGPDGEMLAFWRVGTGIWLSSQGWQTRLVSLMPEEMQETAAEALDLSVGGAGGGRFSERLRF